MRPWIHVQAPPPPEFPHQLTVHDPKLQTELVPHLIPPLNLNRGRAHNDDTADPVPEDQFLSDQSGLNRFAEADIIGDQEINPRHPQGADDGIKLVFLDLNTATERRLERPVIGG
jgi:hypothetical protein